MVFWLIQNILHYIIYLRFGIGKSTIPILPVEFANNKFLLI